MSIENNIPQVEIPTDYPSDMIVRLQDREFLEHASNLNKLAIPIFGIQQAVLREVTSESIDNPAITAAIETGASIYSTAVGIITQPFPYVTNQAEAAALLGAVEFSHHVGLDDEKMVDMFKKADSKMRADAPYLTEVIDETVGRYYHEKGLRDLARYGAAAMRGLHIRVNMRLIEDKHRVA